MKTKIYALALGLAFAGINAQTKRIFETNPKSSKTNFIHKKDGGLLLEQSAGQNHYLNFPSVTDEHGNTFLSIDDMKFTQAVGLTELGTLGNVWLANDLSQSTTAVRVMIFEDNNGKPKGKPASSANSIFYKDIPFNDPAINLEQGENFIDSYLSVDLKLANNNTPIQLEANKTYWIAIALKQNLEGTFIENEKAWTRTSSAARNLDAYIIDEQNYLGLGKDWIKVLDFYEMGTGSPNQYPDDVNGQNISIYGVTNLGTTEVYSTANTNIFPNPATEVISFKNADKVSKTEIYNTAGQIVITSTDKQVNVRKLEKGTYFVKQHLLDGSASSSKFIKK